MLRETFMTLNARLRGEAKICLKKSKKKKSKLNPKNVDGKR